MTSAAEIGGSRSTSRQLVGRDEVLDRLEALLEETVVAGRLTTVLVEGPAGIGKTRVVDELTVRLRGRDVDVAVGHCVAQGGRTLPYAPLVELLAELVQQEGATAVRRWAGPAGVELGRLAPDLLDPGEQPTEGSLGASRLFQALSALLQQLSARCPLVLVVEDLHWADTSTRELLALLARQQRGAVLLLLTLRTDESPVPHGLVGYVAQLAGRGDHRIRLEPLTREEQARQISGILGVPPRRELLDQVYARAEGNPFFAEELLALGPAGELPTTIRDLLMARLEALKPATRQVLRTASLVGREVPHRLIEAVVDVTGDRLERALREAVEAHVLRPEGEALVFRHALLQEAISASLLPGEAARAHRRLAEALTAAPELAGPFGAVAGRIARHWDAAGEPEQALVASVAAGQEASATLAFAESLGHYERALELLDTVPDGQALLDLPRSRLLRWAAEVAHLAAHPELATSLIREALDCADPEDAALRGWLHERLGRYLWMAGDGQGALVAYRQAVVLVPDQPPTRARAAVLSGLSQILMLADRYAESAELAHDAIAVAQAIPDGRSVEGHARCNLGVDLAFLGRVDEGIAELREAIRIADEELDDVDENARALVNLNSVYLMDGRMEDAAATALESVRVGDALGLRRRKGIWCRCDAADVLMQLCRFDHAERLLVEARDLDPQGVDAFRVDLLEGQLRLRQGALDEARAALERGRALSDLLLDPQLLAPLYTSLTDCALARGDPVTANGLLAEGLARVPESAHPFFLVPLQAAGVAAAMSHRPPLLQEAKQQLACAHTAATTIERHLPLVEAELRTAAAAVTQTHEAWAEAAEAWDGLGDRYRSAQARLSGAESLLAAGGSRPTAGSLLVGVITDAREIGARHLCQRAEDLARRARLSVTVDGTGENPYRLTSRELEVLALVADGLTDRAIGGRLYISHRTVERHVSNLLAKLGAERRSELVVTALREGLVPTAPDSSAV